MNLVFGSGIYDEDAFINICDGELDEEEHPTLYSVLESFAEELLGA